MNDNELYDKMIQMLNDKNKSEIILKTLQFKLEEKKYNVLCNELSEFQKEELRKVILCGVKKRKAWDILNFHNCLNCENRIKQDDNNYQYNKPCKIFSRKIIYELYDKKMKCKFYDGGI